jgi:nicotinate-nucleotide adenylyltransferase
MRVSDVEARLGTRFTIDTVRALRRRLPAARLVWIMGADSLADLARWRGWADLMCEIPIAVVARPGWSLRALASPAARRFAHARLPERAAGRFADAAPPAWVFLCAPLHPHASTALRNSA